MNTDLRGWGDAIILPCMAKKGQSGKSKKSVSFGAELEKAFAAPKAERPSALLDTRVIYCGLRRAQSSCDNLEQLKKFPNACVDSIYIDPPFNSNRNYEVFWGETIAWCACTILPIS
jgi:hypothetical protein